MSETAAKVNFKIPNNATWSDPLTFGESSDTTWNFSNKTFHMDIKRNRYDADPLYTLTSGAGEIVVDDVAARVLHFHVLDTDFAPVLLPNEYEYDLIMTDEDGVRTRIMQGCIEVCQGVTENP